MLHITIISHINQSNADFFMEISVVLLQVFISKILRRDLEEMLLDNFGHCQQEGGIPLQENMENKLVDI